MFQAQSVHSQDTPCPPQGAPVHTFHMELLVLSYEFYFQFQWRNCTARPFHSDHITVRNLTLALEGGTISEECTFCSGTSNFGVPLTRLAEKVEVCPAWARGCRVKPSREHMVEARADIKLKRLSAAARHSECPPRGLKCYSRRRWLHYGAPPKHCFT